MFTIINDMDLRSDVENQVGNADVVFAAVLSDVDLFGHQTGHGLIEHRLELPIAGHFAQTVFHTHSNWCQFIPKIALQ